eukprot:760668-Rhodomonas_salina.1
MPLLYATTLLRTTSRTCCYAAPYNLSRMLLRCSVQPYAPRHPYPGGHYRWRMVLGRSILKPYSTPECGWDRRFRFRMLHTPRECRGERSCSMRLRCKAGPTSI